MKHTKMSSVRFVTITSLVIAGYFIFALIYLFNVNRSLSNQVNNQMINDVKYANEFAYWRIDSEMKELESIAAMIKTSPELNPHEMLKTVEEYNNNTSSLLQNYAIVWPDGIGFCDDGIARDFSDENFFKYAIKGKRGITLSNILQNTSEKNFNTYAVPIYDGTYVVAVLAANKLKTSVSSWTNSSVSMVEGLTLVVDSNGDIITDVDSMGENAALLDVEFKDYTNYNQANEEYNKAEVSQVSLKDDSSAYVISVPLGISDCSTVAVVSKLITISYVKSSMEPSIILCLIAFILLAAYTIWLYATRIHYRKNLTAMVYRDQLTGLMNWNAFLNKYEELHAKGEHSQYALTLCDIDGFKVINDVYGQREGNRIIQLMANIIGSKLTGNEYFARVSADNFVILLHTKDDNEIISRINDISETLHFSSSSYAIMTSFGIYKISGKNIDLISMHDRAKLAKNTIKGNHQKIFAFYDEALRQNIIGEKEIENEMEKALENNQFKLYLQPKYSFVTDKIVGAEALVRWDHPNKGLISPGVFIPIFERNEFIRKLDFYIYERVCVMLSNLRNKEQNFIHVPISVNFSRVHLNYPNFCEEVLGVANRYNISPKLIEIELTEGVAINDKCRLNTIIDTLRESGFILTIDDFGSGYSSLNILKDLNIDVIKFDMEFLRNSTNNPKGKSILKNLIFMARELNLKTVAEGVETIEQVQFLKEVGCDIAQGYFYARPIQCDYFIKLITL